MKQHIHLLPHLHKEDVPRHVLALCQRAQEQGVRPSIWAPSGPLRIDLERARIAHEPQKWATGNILARWQSRKKLHRRALQENSLFFVWDPHLALMFAPLAKARNMRWFYGAGALPRAQAPLPGFARRPVGKRRLIRTLLQAEAILTTTEAERSIWQAFDAVLGARVNIIPGTLDLAVFNPEAVSEARLITLTQGWRLPDDQPVILIPDACAPDADTEKILSVLAKIERPFVAVLLDQPERRPPAQARLTAHIRALGLEARVRIPDSAQDWPAAYRVATVVMPAHTPLQAFSLRLLEAQAMGRAVISRAQGGSEDLLQDGQSGWCVPLADPVALQAAIRAALGQSGDARRIMGAAGQAFATSGCAAERQRRAWAKFCAAFSLC